MTFALLVLCSSLVFLHFVVLYTYSTQIVLDENVNECFNETCGVDFNPYSPLILCSYLPDEFRKCEFPPLDHQGNVTARDEAGYGCVKFGGQKYQDVETSRVWCEALSGLECYGERRFLSIQEYPCIKYTGHKFVSTLIYSVLLGFLGMDRFCLGHTGTAVGKLLTLGGFGVWWVVDVILLVLGELRPADHSNWDPYY